MWTVQQRENRFVRFLTRHTVSHHRYAPSSHDLISFQSSMVFSIWRRNHSARSPLENVVQGLSYK